MSKEEIQEFVIDVLQGIQEMGGRSCPALDSQTRPLGSLPDFDSLIGVEATLIITHRLGIKVHSDNVFASDDKESLTIAQVAEAIHLAFTTECENANAI